MKRGHVMGAMVGAVALCGGLTVPPAQAAGASGFTCQESFPSFPGNGSAWCDGSAVSATTNGPTIGELDLVFTYNVANAPYAITESGSYCLEADNDEEDGDANEAEGCPNPGNFTLTQLGAVAVFSTTGTFNGSGVAAFVPTTAKVPDGGPFDGQLTGTFAGT